MREYIQGDIHDVIKKKLYWDLKKNHLKIILLVRL